MLRTSLPFAAVILLAVWFVADFSPAPKPHAKPGAQQVDATPRKPASAPAETRPLAPYAASPFAAVAQASSTVPSSVTPLDTFAQSLNHYQLGTMASEEKRRLKQSLHALKHDPVARNYLLETFFSTAQPQQAQALYALMRDAKLKDVGVLEALIERDSRAPQTLFSTRIVDLIADLGQQASYSKSIDSYLGQIANNRDSQLRNIAATRRIWYLNQHQPHNLSTQEGYLFDPASSVREEVYSLLEARIADQTLPTQTQLANTLQALLRAENLAASAEEKARVSALLAALLHTANGAGT